MGNLYKKFKIKKYNKDLPLVSIIIPCYNYGEYVEEAIDSVLNQTLTNFEIIVVDDGSTDPKTIEILQNLDKPKTKVIHQENLKQATARNNGIKKAKGKYICCLDSDDKLEPTYLEECITKMEIEKLDLCGSWVRLFGDENTVWHTKDLDIETIKDVNTIPCASVFTKEIWKKTRGYKPQVNGYEDWEYWISIAEVGGKGKIIPKPLFLYRKHGSSELGRAQTKHKLLYNKIRQLHTKLYNDNKYLEGIKAANAINYIAENPLTNLKNSGIDIEKLYLRTYFEKQEVIKENKRLYNKIEKLEEMKTNGVQELNNKIIEIENLSKIIKKLKNENKNLTNTLKDIENSYSYRISTSFREKVLDNVISPEKRKKLLKREK